MKKSILIIVIILLNIFLLAQDSSWTIVKTNPIGQYAKNRVGCFWAGPSLKIKLGEVKPGTKVYPIEQRGDVYHIRFEDGQIGWVYFTMLKETQILQINKTTGLHKIQGTSSFRMGEFIDSLKKGDIVTRIGLAEGGGAFFIETNDGVKGAIIRQHAFPKVENEIPKYNASKTKKFLFKQNTNDEIINKSEQLLKSELGIPDALVNRINGDIWYYVYVETYYNKRRYKGISFFVVDNVVVSDSLFGKGKVHLIDKLPLFLTVKRMSFLDISDKFSSKNKRTSSNKKHWTKNFFVRILFFGMFILLLTLAHFMALFLTKLIARINKISNYLLKLIAVVLTILLNYIYFIFIVAHVVKGSSWFVALIMFFITLVSVKSTPQKIDLYRYTFWNRKRKHKKIENEKIKVEEEYEEIDESMQQVDKKNNDHEQNQGKGFEPNEQIHTTNKTDDD